MSTKTRVALFPMYSDTLPVVRYLTHYCPDVEVVELLSSPGSGACGKDAGVLDNREPCGMRVKSYLDADPKAWDELCLLQHESFGMIADSNVEDMYSQMIKIAHNSNRRTINYPYGLEINVGAESYIMETVDARTNAQKRLGSPKQIKTFLILVVGVIPEVNAFEIALNLYGGLKKRLRVIAFSSSKNAGLCGMFGLHDFLYDHLIPSEQKVFMLADELTQKCSKNNADIVLLHLDEALMPISETQTNGFGIIPYIVSQLINPDYCICCLPYGYSDPLFLKELEQGIHGRFGFTPDHWHLSNSMIDFTAIASPQDVGAIHVPIGDVVNTLHNMIKHDYEISCDVLPEYFNKTIETVLSQYEESQLVSSIL